MNFQTLLLILDDFSIYGKCAVIGNAVTKLLKNNDPSTEFDFLLDSKIDESCIEYLNPKYVRKKTLTNLYHLANGELLFLGTKYRIGLYRYIQNIPYQNKEELCMVSKTLKKCPNCNQKRSTIIHTSCFINFMSDLS